MVLGLLLLGWYERSREGEGGLRSQIAMRCGWKRSEGKE